MEKLASQLWMVFCHSNWADIQDIHPIHKLYQSRKTAVKYTVVGREFRTIEDNDNHVLFEIRRDKGTPNEHWMRFLAIRLTDQVDGMLRNFDLSNQPAVTEPV